jgi:hypothetical protein
MTEYQECFGDMDVEKLYVELEHQQSLGFNLGDSVCAWLVDRIALLKRTEEKKPISITAVDYLKFTRTEASETAKQFIHPYYRSGYWNVFRYFVEFTVWLDVNNIKYQVNYDRLD